MSDVILCFWRPWCGADTTVVVANAVLLPERPTHVYVRSVGAACSSTRRDRTRTKALGLASDTTLASISFSKLRGELPRIQCIVGGGDPDTSHSNSTVAPGTWVTRAAGAAVIFTQSCAINLLESPPLDRSELLGSLILRPLVRPHTRNIPIANRSDELISINRTIAFGGFPWETTRIVLDTFSSRSDSDVSPNCYKILFPFTSFPLSFVQHFSSEEKMQQFFFK
uniref:Putative secreted protein n=1 Tax=Lutzomyia longipalpis TaxID=7200 RepID=A0A7G3ALZ2_LUTLO